MFCLKCGAEMPDDANFCLKCGFNFKNMSAPVPNVPAYNPQQDIRRQAAQNEMAKLKKNGSVGGWVFLGCFFGFLATLLAFYGALESSPFVVIVGWGIMLWALSTAWKTYNRKKELGMIIQGRQMITLCPFCKSTNIVAEMVKAGESTSYGKTRVSDNINPLHPFTHTNIKQGAATTQNQYGRMFQCRDCGKVFSNAEVMYK